MSLALLSKTAAKHLTDSLGCTVLTQIEEAESLAPQWERLVKRAERSELTQTPDWLLTWWHVFGGTEGRDLRLGVFWNTDRIVGIVPLLCRRHWYRGCLPFTRLEFLASGEPVEQGIYSNHLGLIWEREFAGQISRRFVAALVEDAFGSWDEIVLPMMSGDTAMPELLMEAFEAAGVRAEISVTAHARFVPLPRTWDAYLGSLDKSKRNKIRRALRAFDDWSHQTTKLECITRPADLRRGKEILIGLHHHRWATANSPGVFRESRYLQFHEQMMQLLAERGALEILILHGRGEPVAAIYNMVWDNKVYSYQGGRRMDLPEHLSPGKVLDVLAIRRAIELRRREFDLLAEEAYYKKLLTSHGRPLVQLRAVRASSKELIRKFGVKSLAALRHGGVPV